MVWKKIGVVGVDSGQLLICDPCYIESEWENEELKEKVEEGGFEEAKGNFSYPACCNRTLKDDSGQLNFKLGHPGVGVVTTTGLGDGCYEVLADIIQSKTFGERVKEVKIRFM